MAACYSGQNYQEQTYIYELKYKYGRNYIMYCE